MSGRGKGHVAIVLVLGAAIAVACGAAFQAPDVSGSLVQVAQSKWPDASRASLEDGRDLFVGSCGRGGFCHKLPTPGSRTADRWPAILDKMAPKAGLDAAQRESVLRYILAVRDLPAAK